MNSKKQTVMKKLFVLFLCVATLPFIAKADNDKAIQFNQLPQMAQQFIQKNFTSTKVSYVKEESEFMDKTYDVIFANGDKVEFNKKGEWKEINCKFNQVPASVIPALIQKHITENHPNTTVKKIEKDKRGYEVKLSNGLELYYNKQFNFVGMDD